MFQFTNWVNRAGLGLNKFTNSGTAANLVLTPNPDAISNPGTPITAQKLNHMENGIQITSDTIDRCFAFFSDFHILANAEAKFARDILLNGFGNSSGMTLNDWTLSTGQISVTTPPAVTQYNYDRYAYTQDPPTYSIGADTDYVSEQFSSGTRTITGYTDAPLSAQGHFIGTGAYNSLTMAYDGQQGKYYRYQISDFSETRTTYELDIDPDLIGDSYLNSWKNAVVETPGAYVKGEYVDSITAPAGLYPDDGVSGAYWYVKTGEVGEIHDPTTDETGYVVNTDGTIISAAAYTATDWIPVSTPYVTVSTSGSVAGTLRLRVACYTGNDVSDFISPIAVNDTYTGGNRTVTVNTTGASYIRVGYITGLSLSVQEPQGSVAIALSDVYTLSEDKNAVTFEAISANDGTATVAFQVTLDGSNWYDITPGSSVSCAPGSSLQLRILGTFIDSTSYTLTCDGFAILCYNAEVEQ